MYVHVCYFTVSTSINDAQVIIIPEDATNSSYSITVNCIINPASTADICEVMVTANGQAAHIGNEFEFVYYKK